MRLSRIAVLALNGLPVEAKARLADLLHCNKQTLYRRIAINRDNSPLTTKASIDFMIAEFNLPEGVDEMLVDDSLLDIDYKRVPDVPSLESGEFSIEELNNA